MSPQGQGFQILPSLWAHFVPITLPGPDTLEHTSKTKQKSC